MKVTKRQLKRIIREERRRLFEQQGRQEIWAIYHSPKDTGESVQEIEAELQQFFGPGALDSVQSTGQGYFGDLTELLFTATEEQLRQYIVQVVGGAQSVADEDLDFMVGDYRPIKWNQL